MVDSDVRERSVQSHRDSGPPFGLIVSKLRRPTIHPGTVRPSSLVDRLARDDVPGRDGEFQRFLGQVAVEAPGGGAAPQDRDQARA